MSKAAELVRVRGLVLVADSDNHRVPLRPRAADLLP
jgi:hypothetical protein